MKYKGVIAVKCYSKTDIGTVREENQDRINVIELCENTFAAIVCDGMGGENAGSEASETAVTVISNIISRGFRKGADENSLRNLLISAVSTANAIVYEKSQLHEEMRGMGTTCVAAIFCEDNAHIVNVGDSRAYFIADGEISQITIDHTIVMDMYSKGDIKKEEMKTHPKRNYLTKAIGVSDSVGPDYFEIKGLENTVFLLCSDGLTGICEDSDILHIINCASDGDPAEILVQHAIDAGSRDNISVIVVDCSGT